MNNYFYIRAHSIFAKKITFFLTCIFTISFAHAGFPSGTLIKVKDGFIPIEKIQNNDKILSPEHSYFFTEKPVIYTKTRITNALLQIIIDKDNSFVCCRDTQFYIPKEKQWRQAEYLNIGDNLLQQSTGRSKIKGITYLNNEAIDVFDITTGKNNIFYISKNAFLVNCLVQSPSIWNSFCSWISTEGPVLVTKSLEILADVALKKVTGDKDFNFKDKELMYGDKSHDELVEDMESRYENKFYNTNIWTNTYHTSNKFQNSKALTICNDKKHLNLNSNPKTPIRYNFKKSSKNDSILEMNRCMALIDVFFTEPLMIEIGMPPIIDPIFYPGGLDDFGTFNTTDQPPVDSGKNVIQQRKITIINPSSDITPITPPNNEPLSTPITKLDNKPLSTPITKLDDAPISTPITPPRSGSIGTPITTKPIEIEYYPITPPNDKIIPTPIPQPKIEIYTTNKPVDNDSLPIAQKNEGESKPFKTVEDIIGEATPQPGKKNRGPTTIYEKPGGWTGVNDDFDSLELKDIKFLDDGMRVGFLPDGRKVTARPDSAGKYDPKTGKRQNDGPPTLEIRGPGKHDCTKIRFLNLFGGINDYKENPFKSIEFFDKNRINKDFFIKFDDSQKIKLTGNFEGGKGPVIDTSIKSDIQENVIKGSEYNLEHKNDTLIKAKFSEDSIVIETNDSINKNIGYNESMQTPKITQSPQYKIGTESLNLDVTDVVNSIPKVIVNKVGESLNNFTASNEMAKHLYQEDLRKQTELSHKEFHKDRIEQYLKAGLERDVVIGSSRLLSSNGYDKLSDNEEKKWESHKLGISSERDGISKNSNSNRTTKKMFPILSKEEWGVLEKLEKGSSPAFISGETLSGEEKKIFEKLILERNNFSNIASDAKISPKEVIEEFPSKLHNDSKNDSFDETFFKTDEGKKYSEYTDYPSRSQKVTTNSVNVTNAKSNINVSTKPNLTTKKELGNLDLKTFGLKNVNKNNSSQCVIINGEVFTLSRKSEFDKFFISNIIKAYEKETERKNETIKRFKEELKKIEKDQKKFTYPENNKTQTKISDHVSKNSISLNIDSKKIVHGKVEYKKVDLNLKNTPENSKEKSNILDSSQKETVLQKLIKGSNDFVNDEKNTLEFNPNNPQNKDNNFQMVAKSMNQFGQAMGHFAEANKIDKIYEYIDKRYKSTGHYLSKEDQEIFDAILYQNGITVDMYKQKIERTLAFELIYCPDRRNVFENINLSVNTRGIKVHLWDISPSCIFKNVQDRYYQYLQIESKKRYIHAKNVVDESHKKNGVYLNKEHVDILNTVLSINKINLTEDQRKRIERQLAVNFLINPDYKTIFEATDFTITKNNNNPNKSVIKNINDVFISVQQRLPDEYSNFLYAIPGKYKEDFIQCLRKSPHTNAVDFIKNDLKLKEQKRRSDLVEKLEKDQLEKEKQRQITFNLNQKTHNRVYRLLHQINPDVEKNEQKI